jgi:hypothetical protein
VTLNGSTVSDNWATSDWESYGGGIHKYDGTLTLNRTTVSGNRVTYTSDPYEAVCAGGGVDNDGGTVTLTISTVSDNQATNCYGNWGGGIFNHNYWGSGATMTITNSTISGNQATGGYYWNAGGGIGNYEGTVMLTDSTVCDNQAAGGEENWGGGINNEAYEEGSVATMTLTNSTVSGNQATGGYENWGGGISNDAYDGGVATMTITNSTISGNQVTSDYENYGGGIGNYDDATLTLTHSTVSDNQVSGGTLNEGGGIDNDATVTLISSIVANSTSGDCFGPISSGGYNLDSDGSCGLAGPGDQSGVNPLLGPLQDNGGPTNTHALLFSSPAIDQITIGTNGCGTTITTDQRGVDRPLPPGGDCDIGAYEFGYPVGGIAVPVDKLRLLVPWLGLAALASLAALGVVVVRKHRSA